MKKLFALLILLTVAFVLTSCTTRKHKVLEARVSCAEEQKFFGETPNYRVTVVVGFNETPFLPDGKVGTPAPYVRLEVIPSRLGKITAPHTVTAHGDDFNLVRAANRYALYADIKSIPNDLKVTVTAGGTPEVIEIRALNSAIIDRDKVLKAVWAEFGRQLKDSLNTREIIIRIVEDRNATDGYNIYAGIIASTAVYNAVLLSSNYKTVAKIKS